MGKVVRAVSEISAEMVEIKGLAGLIAEPKTFAEFAHNLKVNFQNENYVKALSDAEFLASKNHDFYDLWATHALILEKAGKSKDEVIEYFKRKFPVGNAEKHFRIKEVLDDLIIDSDIFLNKSKSESVWKSF